MNANESVTHDENGRALPGVRAENAKKRPGLRSIVGGAILASVLIAGPGLLGAKDSAHSHGPEDTPLDSSNENLGGVVGSGIQTTPEGQSSITLEATSPPAQPQAPELATGIEDQLPNGNIRE